MNVVIHTTKARADALAAIVRGEAAYAKSQLDKSEGILSLLDEAVSDILADIEANEPETLVTTEGLRDYPEPGPVEPKCRKKEDGIRMTHGVRIALRVLADGGWHFRYEFREAGIPQGTIAGMVNNLVKHGLVETRGNRFNNQIRLKNV